MNVADEPKVDGENTIKLSNPINGRPSIVFDFSKIKGATLLMCEKKAKEVDNTIVVPQLSMVYQAHVAAAAAGMRYDDIINLSGPDFMAVTTRVSRFLNNAG
ncbi:MAG: hypothetical protein E7201_00775 [Selenomonas ruminantium]|uniref:Phage tail assembly chaperone protein, E, or 41 or 14 n=1 Tax=Selenomonas ruminantium TaxID=971 RepID=A0A927ZWK4_SELRU|nr:hypothetical protein [Selenomonas ruminantium]